MSSRKVWPSQTGTQQDDFRALQMRRDDLDEDGKMFDLERLPDDCLTNVLQFLDGEDLFNLCAVNRRMYKLTDSPTIWCSACTKLPSFCEASSVGVSVTMKDEDWRPLYWALRRSIPAITSPLQLPSCVDLRISGRRVKFCGPIGGDRAVRAHHGWEMPPPNHDTEAPDDGAWSVPPALVPSARGDGMAEYLLSPACCYFEVSLHPPRASARRIMSPDDDGAGWCVAVGLSTGDFGLSGKQPGWDLRSCAYHGDDGRVFFGNGCAATLPTFGAGDTVGCGLHRDGSIFFTRNGRLVGIVPDLLPLLAAGARPGAPASPAPPAAPARLHPTVGIDSYCPVEINLGRRPFAYDLRDLQDRAGWAGLVAAAAADAANLRARLRTALRPAPPALRSAAPPAAGFSPRCLCTVS